jgi:hypothetical protein
MYELRGHLLGDASIFTFTRGCADFRDTTAVFRLIGNLSAIFSDGYLPQTRRYDKSEIDPRLHLQG